MIDKQSRAHRTFVILFHMGCLLILLVSVLLERYHGPKAIFADNIGQVKENAEVRNELLMNAMQYVGVSEPRAAVQLWVTGLMQRSGAIQYAVLTKKLRLSYSSCLTKERPNWVTGMSSPWVNGYSLISQEPLLHGGTRYVIQVSTIATTIPERQYEAVLEVVEEDGFYRISNITADPELRNYIGCDLFSSD